MSLKKPPTRFVAYLAAVLVPVVVSGLILGIWPSAQPYPFSPFILAIGGIAWFGGFGPGLISVGVSVLLLNYFSNGGPHFSWPATVDQLEDIGTVVLVGVTITLLMDSLQRALKRARSMLSSFAASEARYRDLIENAHDIIYTQDLKGNYTSVNEAAERVMGYSREESLSMNLIDVVAPEDREKAQEMFAQKLSGTDASAYELEVISKDGRRVAVEIRTRLNLEDGVAVSIQGIARDISERKRLEAQFRQSQKMEGIGQLAGGIAHDFNNLLTVISGHSQLTMAKLHSDDPLYRHQTAIEKAAERAAGLTRQLLAFSRKQLLKPVVLNVNAVVTDVESMLRRLIGEHIDLCAVLGSDLCNVLADRTQVEQLLINLAVNSRDAMPNGGQLLIETEEVDLDSAFVKQHPGMKPGRYILLKVRDEGIGMDQSTVARVFEPFFTTKELGKGTGLGLSTVYGIVKQSDGYVAVKSALGQGSTFSVYLPCVDEDAPTITVDTVSASLRGTETILLVEDEESVRRLAGEILRNLGYQILEAAHGRAALSVAAGVGDTVDLIVTDVVMPGMSGPETVAGLDEHCPHAKVLFMSGYIDDEVSRRGVLHEEVNFIQKPFTPDSLARKIRGILDESPVAMSLVP
jgi:two-component system cell cycle sensor histidine kinase/response regulator CckA